MKVAVTTGTVRRAGWHPQYLGMVLFLVSEIFLFGSLFWTYYYLKYTSAAWPPAGVHPDIILAGLNTFFLLASSGTIWWAGRSIQQGREGRLAAGLIATISLGLIFLGITIFEWLTLPFRPWSHAYGSVFYTLIGFHALHVFGGVLLLSALLARTLRHRFSADRYQAIEVGSLYWHFVDIIWLLVFTTVFIVR